MKSLNYLNSIQAKWEAIQYRADDAIFLDTRGFVSESPICNVFLVSSGVLATPQVSNGILHGITRKNVIEIARELGMAVQERDITPYELIHADEVFLTGTHAEIVPVVKVNNLPIGNGEPGPTTLELIARYRRRTADPRFGVTIDWRYGW
ncbi:aminotransferase class IV [Alicyclobacillus sacchari]|uniref:aminotransferase class IV n=1 Tax=Alicyclobacillus sacchari TaxID=392010 RepID=UPI003C7C33AE